MPSINRRRFCALIAGAAATPRTFAQASYPNKPVRMVVPWSVGTPADLVGRVVAERMSAVMNQSVYVENRNGVSGTVAIPEVMRWPADGHTLYMLASTSLVAPVLYPSMSIDFLRDFDPVGQVDWSYNILCVSPTSPYQNVAEIVEAARRSPGKLTYASGGNGTPPHLAGEMLGIAASTPINHIPYVQMGQAAGDVMTGLVDMIFMGAAGALPLVRDGRLRPLAITAQERASALPAVPTMIESGYADFVIRPFDGLLVKKGVPAATLKTLSSALIESLQQPALRERLDTLGMEPAPSSPEAFSALLAKESARWVALAKQAKLKVG